MKLFKLSLLLTILFALCAVAHAEVVGRVLMAAGDASIIRNNQELRIAVGSPVEDKDTLKTGPFSNMQVRFTDESVVSLRDQSLLKIDEYKFTGKQDGMEKAFFNLLKGGFRTITGLIGKVNKSNYGVKTATATIGIRGTHFALLHCTAGSCGAAAKDGVYGGVSGGIIAATNNTGEYQFGSGDYFYAPSKDSPVKKLIGPPGFFADHLAGQHRHGKPLSGRGNEQAENGGYALDGSPNFYSVVFASLVQAPPPPAYVVTENKRSDGSPCVLPGSTSCSVPGIPTTSGAPSTTPPPAVFPSTGAGGFIFYPMASNISQGFTICAGPISLCGGASAGFFKGTNGQMVQFSGVDSLSGVTNVGSISSASGTASVLDSGSNASAGNLFWGRWLGTGATVNGSTFGLTANSNLHYAIGDMPTMPTSGQATYNPVGGTSPTNANGFTGAFLGGSVFVDFTLRQLSVNNLMIGFNSASYTMNGGMQPYLANGAFRGGLGGTCSGANCGTSPPSGGYAGSFTGANAPGLAMVYQVNDSSGPNGVISGAQGFKR